MSESNKILTVSYGTFSCTLEGFDDPFGTMRGIAEYFRDLAADDRYFGAEPPTPDVEMLQNIAQKEVQRRVEARIGEGSVSLRQMSAAPAAAPPTPAARPEAVTDKIDAETLEHGPLAMDDDYLMSDEPEDVLTVDTDAVVADSGPAETVAEKLRRIRAVVSRTRTHEDEVSFDQAPAARRERALSETIASITADLSDDDDVDVDLTAPATPEEAETAEFDEEPIIGISEDAEEGSVEPEEDLSSDDDAIRSVLQAAEEDDGFEPEEEEDVAAEDVATVVTARRSSLPLAPISDDDSGRLMAETDEKLAEDDGIRRRRVISQMRAAVAATKAERSFAGEPPSREDREAAEQSNYRQDLSEVVISREQDEEDLAAMAHIDRPAPLVLVSSQRVDEIKATAAPEETGIEPATGFAEFAEQAGAKELPDLLEAAAAYVAFVKGQPHFSRPEIMKRVARFDPDMNLSREAGLRSFGQLLRQGKIQKLQRGQFTIPEDTRFNPAHRIAGE